MSCRRERDQDECLGVVDVEKQRAVTIPVHSPFSNFWRLPRAWRAPSGCCHFAFAARNPRHANGSTPPRSRTTRYVPLSWRPLCGVRGLREGPSLSKGPGEPGQAQATSRSCPFPLLTQAHPHRTFPFPGPSVIIAPHPKDELSVGSRRHTQFISHPISRTITNRFDSSANNSYSI